MSQPCRVMIVEEAGAAAPLSQRLLDQYHVDFRTQRVDSEADLRALAREFGPDVVLGTDDLPATPDAEGSLLRLLSRHTPEVLICEVGDGNQVHWQPRSAPRRTVGPRAATKPALKAGASFQNVQGLPAFFAASPDAVVIVDAEGWIGYANPSACALLGRYFPEPVGTYLAAGSARCRSGWSGEPLGSNVVQLRVHLPRPVHGLAVFEQSSRIATRVHLEDLMRAKTARGRDRDACLPLVALELSGLQQLSEGFGRGVCDELFGVITSAVQPQYARCGLVAHLGTGEHLVVLPHVSEAADAAVAVQGQPARGQEYEITDEFRLFEESPVNDPPVLHDMVRTPRVAALRSVTPGQAHLGDALRRRAISVHYQPQYDADTGEGCGLEALARWTLSNGETLMPGAFLPIAERTGMIGRLGAVVLDDACATATAWRGREAERLTLAVNVSTSQITPEYTRTLSDTLKRCGFPARRLELEIDEEALIDASAVTLECVREWRGLGVRIAVNHHGSNYSGLGYLSHTRVDRLKLDRTLVQRMTEHRNVAAFVHAVISLGREFDVDVLAQGVEDAAQLNMLREMGCRHVQGFLLARPMPAVQAQLALRRNFGNLPRAALDAAPAAQVH